MSQQSFHQQTATGSDINFTIDTFESDEIKVYVDGVLKTAGNHYNINPYNANGQSTVDWIGTAPSSPSIVRIVRETDVLNAGNTAVEGRAEYQAGASVKADDLNNNQKQVLRALQEHNDQKIQSYDFEAGAVNTAAIADDSITTAKIPNDAVTNAKLADNSVQTSTIADDSITTAKIPNNAVTTPKIADDSVTTAKIPNNAIVTAKIANDSVTTDKIPNDGITNAKIANDQIDSRHYVDGSIDTDHLANNAVTTAKIANDSITTAKIPNDAVTTAKIANTNITTAKIANSAVTANKIADGTVGTLELANDSVTTAKIPNDAVTRAKIADDAINGSKIADNAIDSVHYTDGSIDSIHLSANCVVSSKIADNAVNTTDINNEAVTTGKIANGNVTRPKIANDAIDGTKIADNAIDSEHYIDGSIDREHLEADIIDSSKLADDSVDSEHIAAGALDNEHYAAGSITSDKLADALIVRNAEQAGHSVNDTSVFTTSAAEARYFNASTGETIKDGQAFPDNDTTIATTAAINDRIIDLVDDVGGFVPIANETSFPTANPDVNNGAGTLVSIKAIGSTRTPSTGTVTIANGSGSNTVTITGCGSTVLTAGFGVIVETTSTLHTYAFHRLVPKATEVTTVASNINNIVNAGSNTTNINTVAGISNNVTTVAGISGNVTTVAGIQGNVTTVAGISSNVTAVANDATDIGVVAGKATEIGRLGTADAVADMNTLGTTAIVSDMDTLADISSNITTVANNDNNVTTVAGIASNVTTVAGISSNVTSVANNNSNVTSVANNMANVNNFNDKYQIAANNPSTDGGGNALAAGDLYFNTSANELKVYTGSAWQGGVTATGNFAVTTGNTFTGDNTYNDNVKLLLGGSTDLQIYHDGSTASILRAKAGDQLSSQADTIWFRNAANSETTAKFLGNGAAELYYDNVKRFETTANGVLVGASYTASGLADDLIVHNSGDNCGITIAANSSGRSSINFADAESSNISFMEYNHSANRYRHYVNGTMAVQIDDDLQVRLGKGSFGGMTSGVIAYGNAGSIKKDSLLVLNATASVTGRGAGVAVGGNTEMIASFYAQKAGNADSAGGNAFLESKGNLTINVQDSETGIDVNGNGAVDLYYDNAKKFETLSTGAKVTGHLEATGTLTCGQLNSGTQIVAGNPTLRLRTTNNSLANKGTIEFYYNTSNLSAQIRGKSRNGSNGQIYLDVEDSSTMTNIVYIHDAGLDMSHGNLNIPNDTYKLRIGDSADLEAYHDGTDSYLVNKTGDLYITSTGSADDIHIISLDDISLKPQGGENGIYIYGNGGVGLYYDSAQKFITTSTGGTLTGTLVADSVDAGNSTFNGINCTVVTDGSTDNGAFLIAGDTGAGNRPKLRLKGAGSAGLGADAIQVFYNNGSDKSFEVDYQGNIDARTLTTTAGSTFNGAVDINGTNYIRFGDNDELQMGFNSNALLLYGSNTFFASGETFRVVNQGISENILWAKHNGEVELYYDNSLKTETYGDGLIVYGKLNFDADSDTFIDRPNSNQIEVTVANKEVATFIDGSNNRPAMLIDKGQANNDAGGANYNSNGNANDLVVGNVASGNHGITICSASDSTGTLNFSDGSGAGQDAYRGAVSYDHVNEITFVRAKTGSVALRQNATDILLATSSGATITGNLAVNSGTTNTCATFTSTDAGAVINLTDNSARSSIEQNGTDLKIISDTDASDANSTIKFLVDNSTKMTLATNGYLGIGTTTPEEELTIASSNPCLRLNDDSNYHRIVSSGENLALICDAGNTQNNSALEFRVDGENVRCKVTSHGLTPNPSDSASANALDDYEEGTFTPTIMFGNSFNGSYSTQAGFYTKVGRHVSFMLRLTLSDRGSNTGSVRIGGLPFTTANLTNANCGAYFGYLGNMSNSQRWVCHQTPTMDPNATRINLRRFETNLGSSSVDHAHDSFGNSSDIIMSGHYITL